MAPPLRVAAPLSVFVSHTTRDHRDSALAHYLADGLTKLGAKSWIAPESLPIGHRWKEPLVSAILNDCSHFLVIVSAASIEAPWVIREIELARQRAGDDDSFAVLPLLVGAVESNEALEFVQLFQAVPYSDDPHEQLAAAAGALGLDYTPPAQPADHLRAKDYLDRGIEREKETLQEVRRIRWASPAVGVALAAGLFLASPGTANAWAGALAAAPFVTGLAGWGATWRRFVSAENQLRKLDVMKDSLDVCMEAESESCHEIWQAFWHYVEARALTLA